MNKYDVVVIGAGLGGLSAGAYLSKSGKKVLVLEQHNIVGGCATIFKRKGVKCEAGLHEMDFGTYKDDAKHAIFKRIGLLDRIKIVNIPNLWDIRTKSEHYRIPEGHENVKEYLVSKFPKEESAIKRYFRAIKTTAYPFRRLPADLSFWQFFFYPITSLPIIIKEFFSQSNVGSKMDEIFSDEKLKQILNANLLYYSDDPYKFSWFYHSIAQNNYYNSGVFVKGGSQELSNALADIIRENGGEILLNCEATHINTSGDVAKEVVFFDKKAKESRSVAFDKIIANCAPSLIYKDSMLDSKYHDKSLEELKEAVSLYTTYIIFKKSLNELFPDNAYSTFLPNDDEFGDSLKNLNKHLSMPVLQKDGFVFVDYSKIDSGLVKDDDQRSFGVLCGGSYISEWEGLDDEAYAQKKKALEEKLMDKLEEFYPGIKENVEYLETSTPKTIKRYILAPSGTAYGYVQKGFLKGRAPHKSRTIKNLYFTGAYGFPGGGFTGAIISGYLTATNVLFPIKYYVALKTLFVAVACTAVVEIIKFILGA